jgi:peptidylprolyl isomerase
VLVYDFEQTLITELMLPCQLAFIKINFAKHKWIDFPTILQCRDRICRVYNMAYLKENKMSNELKIEDLQLGEGKEAVRGALITTQYRGFLEDGTQFDSSYDRGVPFKCVIGTGRVIKGWDQGLMGMKVGGKRKLWVPAHLAYGERQIGEHIKPNSNLIFELELLEVLTRDE